MPLRTGSFDISPTVYRCTDGVPYAAAALNDAEVKVFAVSKKIDARASSIDGVFALRELYLLAWAEAIAMHRDLVSVE